MAAPGSPCDGLILCPVCGGTLERRESSLRCPAAHTFDVAREGYVHLLPSGHGRSGIEGDTAAMLRARRRFLERGHYEPLARALAGRILEHWRTRAARTDPNPPSPAGPGAAPAGPVVVDAGCGEGYYLRRVSEGLETASHRGCYIGFDVSKAAVRLAARAHPGATFLVNDVTERVCVATGAADALLDVFAPRNAAEFRRVLAPGGLLVVVIPAEDHLAELRASLPLLGIEEDKPERTAARFQDGFVPAGREPIRVGLDLEPDDIVDLLRMTPHRWHLDDAALDRARAHTGRVTASFLVLGFRRIG